MKIIKSIIRNALALIMLIEVYKETGIMTTIFCAVIVVIWEIDYWNNLRQIKINKNFINSLNTLSEGIKSNHETISYIADIVNKNK